MSIRSGGSSHLGVMRDSHRLPVLAVSMIALAACAACGGQTSIAACALPSYGDPICDRYGQIQILGQYMLQNNKFNDATVTQDQCVNALWDGEGTRAGFVVSPVAIDVPGPMSGTYPALVLGWHWGKFY